VTARERRGHASRRATVLGLGLVLLAACEFPSVLVPSHDLLYDVYTRGPATVPDVALTFDDGPNGRCTADVLDVLAATATPATFFVLGSNLAHPENAALLARMLREGHALGIHGWAHSTTPTMDQAWAARDLARTRDAITSAASATGSPAPVVRFYRPPYGFLTGPLARAVGAADLAIVEWTVSVEDWRTGWTAAALADAIARRTRPGDVIVLHDGNETGHASLTTCVDRPVLAEAVRRLVPALQMRGLHVAPLATVLGFPDPSR
jgi:peptidoglycan/xylan/chitin deacetylase (PgdA/CDA1 family)